MDLPPHTDGVGDATGFHGAAGQGSVVIRGLWCFYAHGTIGTRRIGLRIEQLRLDGWKGLDVVLAWSQVVVLFGANDAGKSNVLEAVAAVLDGELHPHRRDDPLRPASVSTRAIVLDLWFRLDHTVSSSPDSEMFASLLTFGTWFPPDSGRSAVRPLYLPDGYAIDVAAVGEMDPGAIREAIRDEVLVWAADKASQWDPVATAFETLVDEALGSNLFWVEFEDISWVFPPKEELTEGARAALGELDRHRHLFDGAEVPLFEPAISGGEEGTELVHTLSWFFVAEQGVPIQVVDLNAEFAYEDAVQRLEDLIRLESSFRDAAAHGGFALAVGREPGLDSWVTKDDDGPGYVVSPIVEGFCAELSLQLTAESPAFVKDVCEILVEPLPIPAWRAAGARVRVALRRLDEEDAYPLTSAGTGVSRFVLLTIELAVAQARSSYRGPRQRPELQTLYVIDEPEMHLHPLAQRDAADWLAEKARNGAELCLATHSPAFLEFPLEDVGYYGVKRSGGRTTAEAVGQDLLSAIRERGTDYGMSAGEVLLLTRAVLVVEGQHDEMVLQHCYGKLLRQHRIVVVPIRGTDNAPGLAETEFLSRVNRRLIVLFDGTLRVKLDSARAAGRLVDRMSKEERAAIELVLGIEERGDTTTQIVPLDVHDVLAAFPEDTMAAAVGALGGTFPGWERVLKAYASAPAENFKTFLLREAGIPSLSPTRLLDAALAVTTPDHPLPGPLHQAVQEVVKLAKRRGV